MSIALPDRSSPWSLDNYFDQMFFINRASRGDRRTSVFAQRDRFQLRKLEQFHAIEIFSSEGVLLPYEGCHLSHRTLLQYALSVPRTLILEDDFLIRHNDFHRRFEQMIQEVPSDWDLLYLGGHYGEPPLARISPHVLRCGQMLGASSYAVTAVHAARLLAIFHPIGAQADCKLSELAHKHDHYILQPRLIVQFKGYSDLAGAVVDPTLSMTDTLHESML